LLDGNGGGTPKQAELVSAQGYEAFGALLPGRNYSSSSYNYGFNGKLKDDEVHGATGTSYDFGARMYDSRVGRFLSLDPYAFRYPGESPYLFAGNNPIFYIDKNGEYKLAPDLQKKYPKLATLVRNLETIMKSNPEVWEAFKGNLGLTEEQATALVRWDSGPELAVAPLPNEPKNVVFGETALEPNGTATVTLNSVMVETMEGQRQSQSVTAQGAAVLTFITLGHEAQHAAEPIVNKGKFLSRLKGEQGFKFEKKAFGRKYDNGNYQLFQGALPQLYDRIQGSSTETTERMEVRPAVIDRESAPEKTPVGP
jgi:RHS repeat-associated protein